MRGRESVDAILADNASPEKAREERRLEEAEAAARQRCETSAELRLRSRRKSQDLGTPTIRARPTDTKQALWGTEGVQQEVEALTAPLQGTPGTKVLGADWVATPGSTPQGFPTPPARKLEGQENTPRVVQMQRDSDTKSQRHVSCFPI